MPLLGHLADMPTRWLVKSPTVKSTSWQRWPICRMSDTVKNSVIWLCCQWVDFAFGNFTVDELACRRLDLLPLCLCTAIWHRYWTRHCAGVPLVHLLLESKTKTLSLVDTTSPLGYASFCCCCCSYCVLPSAHLMWNKLNMQHSFYFISDVRISAHLK